MPVDPPRPANDAIAIETASAATHNNTFARSDDFRHEYPERDDGSLSPVAPAYSPITPKVQPVLPASFSSANDDGEFTFPPVAQQLPHKLGQQGLTEAQGECGSGESGSLPQDQHERQQQQQQQQEQQQQQPQARPAVALTSSVYIAQPKTTQPAQAPRIPPTEYIPQPPPLPFSSEDSGDAIALRAAISTLQFQKKKAQDDIKTLASIKQLALDNPKAFADELAAGQLREQKPSLGNLQSILDSIDDGDDEDEVVLGATREEDGHGGEEEGKSTRPPAEIPSSQPSQPTAPPDFQAKAQPAEGTAQKHFPRIPGPQAVVRMPHVNWGKYGIDGQSLDSLHEQQRRWPGTLHGSHERGRGHAVAAPYSPFLDTLADSDHHHPQQAPSPHGEAVDPTDAGLRKDSGGPHPAPSATGTISEHVMETRSRN